MKKVPRKIFGLRNDAANEHFWISQNNNINVFSMWIV
jgi:hypothetical protein